MELRSGTPHDSEWVAPVGSFMSWSIRPETRRGGEIVTGTVTGSQSDVCAASLGQGSGWLYGARGWSTPAQLTPPERGGAVSFLNNDTGGEERRLGRCMRGMSIEECWGKREGDAGNRVGEQPADVEA